MKLQGIFLKSLYLRNFRNYSEAEATFSPKLNVLYGENGEGKTNVLEAIYLLSTGRSFRTEALSELIRQGETFFLIEGTLFKEGMEHTIQISFDGTQKRLLLDKNNYPSFQPLLGLLPSVLHTPSDRELIEGSPAIRRRFLNLHLAQRNLLYVHHLARYWKAMKQRNAWLKSKESDAIDCWEIEMATSAAYLQEARHHLIDALGALLQRRSEALSLELERHEIRFYPSQPRTAEQYLAQLQKHRLREQQLGFTLTGPHRDDFSLLIGGKEARMFASEGQKKTSLSALRLAEWELFTKTNETPPLFGLDDFGIHLDSKREAALKEEVGQLGQVFVTTPQRAPQWLEGEQKAFLISGGKIGALQACI
jgi:DNA replication and repair protein RecF